MVYPLTADQLLENREQIYSLIDSALNATDCHIYYSAKWVFDRIIAHEMQAWSDRDITYLMVTQILVYPSGHRELNAFAAAGEDMDRLHRPTIDALLEFAKAKHCATIAASGRMGWLRVNRDYPPGPGSVTYRQVKRV